MIKAANIKDYVPYSNYKNFDFYSLSSNNYHHNGNEFLHAEGFTFTDPIGCMQLTGNELLYYPELAKKLRELKEYPTLIRNYTINTKIKGMSFIEHFYNRVRESFNHFQAELAAASSVVNNLIHLYGTQRTAPIMDRIDVEVVSECYQRKRLVISGVAWAINKTYHDKYNVTEYIDFYRLLGISHEFSGLSLEGIIPGTPFIALRLTKTWKHKGHVNWYNLDTLKKVSKTEVKKAK